ncbi:MAG: hypothetical protein O7B35_20285 [Deltaproteobacteria bacterium]|nr:hypothetical protein [Deltaproteobacteria bacterium]
MPGGKEKGSHHGRQKKIYSNFQAAGSGGAVSETSSWPNSAAATISLQGSSCTGRSATREGGLIEGPSQSEKALSARNAELERMVGRLTMENELFKKP